MTTRLGHSARRQALGWSPNGHRVRRCPRFRARARPAASRRAEPIPAISVARAISRCSCSTQLGDVERCALRSGNVHSAYGWIERRFFAALELVSNASNSARLIPLARKAASTNIRSISALRHFQAPARCIRRLSERIAGQKANLGFRLCVHIDLMVALGG